VIYAWVKLKEQVSFENRDTTERQH